jgi:type II secretory pathway pseudopilin PulG
MRNKIERFVLPFTLLLVCVTMTVATLGLLQQSGAVTLACKVQQRGVAAEQQLERFFVDYHQLLGATQKQVDKQLAKMPPRQRRLTRDAIAAVNSYSQIVEKQPKHHGCP